MIDSFGYLLYRATQLRKKSLIYILHFAVLFVTPRPAVYKFQSKFLRKSCLLWANL